MDEYNLGRRDLMQAAAAAVFASALPSVGEAAAKVRYNPSAKFQLNVSDIEYRRNAHGRSLLARIYQPVGPGPFPVVMDLHGGAWNAKNRLSEEPFDRAIAAAGALVVAVDMTLAPDAPYPACIQDANYAVRWLKANAAKWKGDVSRLGVFGSSSGGQVAELIAMRPHDPLYAAIPFPAAPHLDATVDYMCARAPMSDTFARYENAVTMKNATMVKNNTTFFVPFDTIHKSNPIEILERKEPVTLRPFMIIQGALDDNMRPAYQTRFVNAYRAAGGSCEYTIFPGCVHEWVATPGPQTDRAHEMVKAFIARRVNV